MRNVIVCIARDEDHYIDEWLLYHFKLGFSDAWVYQNKWRYSGPLKDDSRVHLVEFDGEQGVAAGTQDKAYNHFIRLANAGHAGPVDFAAFFDVDEFMCLKPGLTLDAFLSRFSDVSGVALNWKLFGDSGLAAPVDGDYSLVKRFTRCDYRVVPPIKTIVNIKRAGPDAMMYKVHILKASLTSDCVLSATGDHFVRAWKNHEKKDPPAWLNHYFCKTREEFKEIKQRRGKLTNGKAGECSYCDKEFDDHNHNYTTDLTALNFYMGAAQC